MIPSPFEYETPETLDEALTLLSTHGDEAKILAGGQSLLPMMKLRLASPKVLIDLRRMSGLAGIRRREKDIVIGALTTHYEIESSAFLTKACPLFPETARSIGDVQVRNQGTLGGSLAHADPTADWPAAVLAVDGELRLLGSDGERWVRGEDFFLGLMSTALKPAELIAEIRFPSLTGRSGGAYFKMPQQASGFAIVGVAASLNLDRQGRCEEIGIGVTGLGAKPFRARAVEQRLRGNKLTPKGIEESAAQVADGVDPQEDMHASAKFRAHLARVFTTRAVREAAKRAGRKNR